VYTINPANYGSHPNFGWCNWWPEAMHPGFQGSAALHQPAHSRPIPGAVVQFTSGAQGAGGDGHYANVVAVHPGGYWVLVGEMNFSWRGAGFGRVSYRYIHTGPGVSFLY
jgi:hypothetical protein